MNQQEVETLIKGIRVGMCNFGRCNCVLENTADGFCEEHWKKMSHQHRQELVRERNAFVKDKKNWFQYSMALAGAVISLKEDAK